MIKQNSYKILVWAVVILLASNLSIGISLWYHKKQDKKFIEKLEETSIEVPSERRTRFFREQLNLQRDQMDTFRELNRSFNRKAWEITNQLESQRIEMVRELGKDNPNDKTLKSISGNIGKLHSELKDETIDYYLKMKAVCNEDQKVKLNEIFISMLKKNEDVKLPEMGRNRLNSE